jgi:hypothetical protein
MGAAVWESGMTLQAGLLLPGALLVAIQTQFLAPLVFVDFGLTAFLE